MDWSKIVKVLTANGFTGDGSDLAAVKAFAADFNLVGEDGTAIDLDAAHKATASKARKPLVVPSVDVDAMKAENAKLRDQARKAASAAAMTGGGTDDDDPHVPQPFKIGNAVAKSYDRKAKKGRNETAFSSSEEAEIFGSLLVTNLMPGRATKRMRDVADMAVKANITTTNTSGGFSVPDMFIPTLIELRELRGAARKVLSFIPIKGDKVDMPRDTGGVTVYWPGEGGNITESNPTGNNVSVTANKMTAITRVSNELLNDSAIAFGDWVARRISYAMADKEDEAVFNGDGTSTYGGHTGFRSKLFSSATVANNAGLVVGSGNLYSELTLTDFIAVMGRTPSYVTGGKWVMHKEFFYNTCVRVGYGVGGVTATEVQDGVMTAKFLGAEVVFAQVMPRVEGNSQVCAIYGDFNQAAKAVEVTGGFQLATDTGGDNFTADVTAFRGVNRVGVTVHDAGNVSATASLRIPGPVVGLITAAS